MSANRKRSGGPNLFADATEMSAYRPRTVAPPVDPPVANDLGGEEQVPADEAAGRDHRSIGDDPLSRCCVARQCLSERAAGQVFCTRHWNELPAELRLSIGKAFAKRQTFKHRKLLVKAIEQLLVQAIDLLGRQAADPPLPKTFCRVPDCRVECVGGFCPQHARKLPAELREQLRREMGPRGSVRKAWALLAEAERYLSEACTT